MHINTPQVWKFYNNAILQQAKTENCGGIKFYIHIIIYQLKLNLLVNFSKKIKIACLKIINLFSKFQF
jgi:hypothetical protein